MARGYVLSLLSTLCFALPTVFTPFAYEDGLTPKSLVFNQTLIAAILLFLYMKVIGEPFPALTRRSVRDFFLAGAGKAVTVGTMFLAIELMNVSLVLTLIFMYPAFVVLMELLIDKKKLSLQQIAGLVCTFVGELLVLKVFQGEFHQLSVMGTVLAILSGFSWGWMIYWSNKKLASFSSIIVTSYTTLISVVLYLFFIPPVYLFTTQLTLPMIGWSLFFGGVAQVLALLFMFTAIQRIGAARFSIISVFELPLTVFLAFLIVGEQMDGWQIVGGLLIVAGIILFDWLQIRSVLTERSSQKTNSPAPTP